MLQAIVVVTTIISNFSVRVLENICYSTGLEHLFYQCPFIFKLWNIIRAFCLRYLYVREQWLHQQYAELNARIQAMQARIHPHFYLIV